MQPKREKEKRASSSHPVDRGGDGTCSFSPLLQEPLYFLLLRPTANPLARPISFSTPAYRFPFHAAPCRFLPCFHRVIPIFLRRCPPSPTVYYANIIFRRGGRGNSSNERNGQWPRRRLVSWNMERDAVRKRRNYEYIAIFRPLTSLWRENVKHGVRFLIQEICFRATFEFL